MKRKFLPRLLTLVLSSALVWNPSSLILISQDTLAPSRAGIPMRLTLEKGDRFSFTATVTEQQQRLYSKFSEDLNWPHLNPELAKKLFGGVVVHGMHTSSLSLNGLAAELAKVRASYDIVSEESVYTAPVFIGDQIRFEVEVAEVSDAGKTIVEIKGWKGEKQVLDQTVELAEPREDERSSLEVAVFAEEEMRNEPSLAPKPISLDGLTPTERVSPPVYLVGETRQYTWEMDDAKITQLAALLKDSLYSDLKVAKAILTYAAATMFPSSLFVKSRIVEMRRGIPLAGAMKITARVKEYVKEGKKRGRSLTEISVKDQYENLIFRGEIDMKAFPYKKDELLELAKSKDRGKNLATIVQGKNQPDLEMIFDSLLRPDISGVELIDEYQEAITKDPTKTLERAKQIIGEMKLKVLIAGVGGIGGGMAEVLGQIPGVELTVLTRDDAGSRRIAEKFAAAGIRNYHDIRISDPDNSVDGYVSAVYEAKKKMGGLDVMFIGTGTSHPSKDVLLPPEDTPEAVIAHLKDLPKKIHWVNVEIVNALFTASARSGAKNIFTIGSVHGRYPRNDFVNAYSRSKASNRLLAMSWPGMYVGKGAPEDAMGISIAADYILSQMTADVLTAVVEGTDLGFIMTPKQLAEAATWLIAFHNHRGLDLMRLDKKTQKMVPNTAKARSEGVHEVQLPGEKSAAKIKEKLTAKKEPVKPVAAEAPKKPIDIDTRLDGLLTGRPPIIVHPATGPFAPAKGIETAI